MDYSSRYSETCLTSHLSRVVTSLFQAAWTSPKLATLEMYSGPQLILLIILIQSLYSKVVHVDS